MAETTGELRIGEPEKRFGLIAIEKGYITPNDLIEALKEQIEEDVHKRKHRLIGNILRARGKMTDEQIQDVLKGLPQKK
jgi:hypothetical protein